MKLSKTAMRFMRHLEQNVYNTTNPKPDTITRNTLTELFEVKGTVVTSDNHIKFTNDNGFTIDYPFWLTNDKQFRSSRGVYKLDWTSYNNGLQEYLDWETRNKRVSQVSA